MGASRHTASFVRSIFFPEIADSATGSDILVLDYATTKSINDIAESLDTLTNTIQSFIDDQNTSVVENVVTQIIIPLFISDQNGVNTEEVSVLVIYDIQVSDDGTGVDIVDIFHVYSELPITSIFSPSMRIYLLRRGKILQPGIQCYLRQEMGDVSSLVISDFTYINTTISDVAADT